MRIIGIIMLLFLGAWIIQAPSSGPPPPVLTEPGFVDLTHTFIILNGN